MLSFIAKLMLTISALAPVALIYSLVAAFQANFEVAFWAGAASILAASLCAAVLHVGGRKASRSKFTAKGIEAADGENVGFMLLYLLPLFSDKIETLRWELWLPTLVLLGLLIGNGYAHHFNPLLGLFGWHFYKVTSNEGVTFVLISRKRLANAIGTLTVSQLTDNILYDLGGKYDHDTSGVLPT